MHDNVVLVTGGAGFIGSAVIRYLISETDVAVVNVDKLTYAANLANLATIEKDQRYHFERCDVCHATNIARILDHYAPGVVMHLAAESHVDRSIEGPMSFVQTNVVGTATLLTATLSYWRSLSAAERRRFRFHHISTDEVYGSLDSSGLFTEQSPYQPNSPYSASKASADHLVRAWSRTFGLPTVTSNCSNNYGPYQHPEKLIPLMILSGLEGRPMPVYGKGENIRDWLYVEDHARALWTIVREGRLGESYNVGGLCELPNLVVVEMICDLLDELAPPLSGGRRRRELISFVSDRPGHDLRYAIDASKVRRELGWQPHHNFPSGLRRTVEWFLANDGWWRSSRNSAMERKGLVREPHSTLSASAQSENH